MLTPASAPFLPIPVGSVDMLDLWRATSPATAGSTWPWPAIIQPRQQHPCGRSLGARGQRRRHLPTRGPVRNVVVGSHTASSPVTSTATAVSTSRSPAPMRSGHVKSACCWATATARYSPGDVRGGVVPSAWAIPSIRHRGGRLRRRRPARPRRRRLQLQLRHELRGGRSLGARGQRRRDFQPAVQYATESNPTAMVAGDFTGDGRLDLAVAGYNLSPVTYTEVGEVSVLLGNGDGTFQPAVQYAAGADPTGIVAGDFTGDGRLDLAVAGVNGPQDREVSVFLGNGDGTFQPAVQERFPQEPSWGYRGGGLHRERPPRPGRRLLRLRRHLRAAGQRRWDVPVRSRVHGQKRSLCDRGGGLHRERPPRPGRGEFWPTPPSPSCWATATAPSNPCFKQATQWDRPQAPPWRATSRATADSTSPSKTRMASSPPGQRRRDLPARGKRSRWGQWPGPRGGGLQRRRPARPGRPGTDPSGGGLGAAGQRRRHIPARGHSTRWGWFQTLSWRATSPAMAGSTSPSQARITPRSPAKFPCSWATVTAPSSPPWNTRWDRTPGYIVAGGLQRRRQARPGRGRLQLQLCHSDLSRRALGAPGQRRRHLPAPGHVRRGVVSRVHRGGRFQRRRPHSTWRSQTSPSMRAQFWCCWAMAMGPSNPRSRTRVGCRLHPASSRVTSTVMAASTWLWSATATTPSPATMTAKSRCCWATAMAPSSPRSRTPWGRPRRRSWRGISTATASSTWPPRTIATTTCRCCWAKGMVRS